MLKVTQKVHSFQGVENIYIHRCNGSNIHYAAVIYTAIISKLSYMDKAESILKSSFSAILLFKVKMRDAVDIWIKFDNVQSQTLAQ